MTNTEGGIKSMAITFESPAQEACFKKVAMWMKELFGESARAFPDSPAFATRNGSSLVFTSVNSWSDDDAVIQCYSFVVTGAQLTPELTRFLLDENNKVRFGAFSIDPQGDILFGHSIVGSTCDRGELEASVGAVSYTADQYDDQIVQRWGGERALDRSG
jgi:hypothetical protein